MAATRRLSQIPDEDLSAEAENVCLSCAAEFRTSSGVVQTEKITCFGVTASSGEEECEFVSVSAALNFIFQFPPTNRIDERLENRLGCCPVCSGIIGQLYGLHKQLQELNNSHSVISMTMKSALATFAKSAPSNVIPVRNSVIVPESTGSGPLKRPRVENISESVGAGGIMSKTEYSVSVIPNYSHNSFSMGNGPSPAYSTQSLVGEGTEQKPIVAYNQVEIEEQIAEGVYIVPDTELQEGDPRGSGMKYNFTTCQSCFTKVENGKDGRGLERHIAAYHSENSGSLQSRNDHNPSGTVPGNGLMQQGHYSYDEVNGNQNQTGRGISDVDLLE